MYSTDRDGLALRFSVNVASLFCRQSYERLARRSAHVARGHAPRISLLNRRRLRDRLPHHRLSSSVLNVVAPPCRPCSAFISPRHPRRHATARARIRSRLHTRHPRHLRRRHRGSAPHVHTSINDWDFVLANAVLPCRCHADANADDNADANASIVASTDASTDASPDASPDARPVASADASPCRSHLASIVASPVASIVASLPLPVPMPVPMPVPKPAPLPAQCQ